jgi:hypothetical protein
LETLDPELADFEVEDEEDPEKRPVRFNIKLLTVVCLPTAATEVGEGSIGLLLSTPPVVVVAMVAPEDDKACGDDKVDRLEGEGDDKD